MTSHVPDDLLRSFVDGDLADHLAVEVAEHVDACPACATRAATLEPLAAAFAAVRDPLPPAGLADRILLELDRPQRSSARELAVGAALLAAGGLLASLLGSPLSFTADLVVLLDAGAALGRGLATGLASFQLAVVGATLAALAGGLLTLHYGTFAAASPPFWRST